MDLVTVYATAASEDEAVRIAEALVAERLVACVNVLPGVTSVYRWTSEVCRDAEVAIFAKTTAERFERVAARIRELHSYETPCVVAWPAAAADADYAAWVRDAAEDRR